MEVGVIMNLEYLNDRQKEAVLYGDGPLLILAGAGSGKTSVLTKRVAYLIKERNVSPKNIVAITFTNKAAKEMKERIIKEVGKEGYDIQISTFHSFGLRIIKENYEKLGYEKNFTIIDSDDSLTVVKKILKEMGIDSTRFNPKFIKNQISSCKNEMVTPEKYKNLVNDELSDITYKVYKKYQDTLLRNNSLDFDDLLIKPIELFNKYKEVLENYQELFKYVFIDEYQDTNEAQYILSKMISAKYKNICVVGDDSQCLARNTIIDTKDGNKKIEDIKKGDLVKTASGFGATTYKKVVDVMKKKYTGDIIKVTLESGRKVRATKEHITFFKLLPENNKFYVYLMYKKELGFRIGQTSGVRCGKNKIKNGIEIRLNGEAADKIWIIKVCNSKEEATYYEEYYSSYYGIPKIVFNGKGRNVVISQEKIDELFKKIPTQERADKLMNDENLFFEYPHHVSSAVVRGNSVRRIINVSFLAGRYAKNSNTCSHRISLITSGEDERIKLSNLGFNTRNSKGGKWRIETERKEYDHAEYFARMVEDLTDGYDILRKMKLTDESYNFIPFGSLRQGMHLIILEDNNLISDKIVNVEKEFYDDDVYDINVEDTKNYFANSLCVHNCIYSWRGANFKNILNFEKDYKNAKVILLEQNYRSTKTILNAANSVIKNNINKKDKNLWTDNETGEKIKYVRTNDEKDEASYVTREIRNLVNNGVSLDDIAVLYRTNAQSRTIEEGFLNSNIPYRIVGAFAFYSRKEIKDLLAYLKLIYNTKDDVSLMRIINYPKRKIGAKTIENLSMDAVLNGTSMFDVISSGKELEFKKLILEMKEKSEVLSLTETIDMVLDKSGIKSELESEHTLEADIRLENLNEFKSITKTFEEESGIASLEDFLNEVSLVSDVNDQKNDNSPKVTLMTIHAVKGLEYKYVFVIGMEENIFPHVNSCEEDGGIEEERRLCYVAITRAKEKLYLVNALRRMLYGKTSVNMPSRFINEIDKDLIDAPEKKMINMKFNKKEAFNDDNGLKAGDNVIHDIYGPGVVVNVDKSIATIAFKGQGIKKLMKNHKSIKKVS